jgi:putative DNA primase/helicase
MYIDLGNRLPRCKAVEDATAKYRKDMDIIGRFADECLFFKPTAVTMGPEIYKAYQSWCRDNGTLAMGSRRFYPELLKRYSQVNKRNVSGGASLEGVGLLRDGVCMDADMVG